MPFGITQDQINESMTELQAMDEEERGQYLEEESDHIDDGHLVEFVEQCVREDYNSSRERRRLDETLWEAHENKMREMDQKEAWQAKIVLNDPFATVYQAKALIRKSVTDRPDYFSIKAQDDLDEPAKAKALFWQDSLRFWAKQAEMEKLLPDMAEMSLAIGISLGAKISWVTDDFGKHHLRMTPILPWKIYRDPDAKGRQPQSGLYCIHEEWIDWHKLVEGEKQGLYINISQVLRTDPAEFGLTQDERRRREGRTYTRHEFRKAVLVREFYGDILDHNSELVMSKMRFMVANRTLIMQPTPSPFPRLRWPIHQFSALPSLVNFHGYSIIEGVLKMWRLRNNLLSITSDNLSFKLNTAYEVDHHKLLNPADTEIYPGALKFKKANVQGNVYEPIKHDFDAERILPILWNLTGAQFEKGSFVTELIQGGFGQRRDTTAREVEIKTQQALGVFDSIGKDVEYGLIGAIKMMQEVLALLWDPTDGSAYRRIAEEHQGFLMELERMDQAQRLDALVLDADVRIRGVSLILERASFLERIRDAIATTDNPRFTNFVKDYELIQRYFDTLDFPEVVLTEKELELQQQLQQEAELRQLLAGGAEGTQPEANGTGVPSTTKRAPSASPPKPSPSPQQPAGVA